MNFISIILAVEIILFLTNLSFNTSLIGWDNIMPEFNISANLQRSLFGVWQEHRGLGLLDGMSHIANLFHTIYIWIISSLSGLQLARPIFLHLTHLAGGIGFFYLALFITKSKKASFLGALLYMFNLGVIQMYFAPLEAFAVHFAALPIVLLFTIKSLENPTRKNLLFLFLAALLTTPQSFVPTLFLVLLIPFFSIVAFYLLQERKWKTVFLVSFVFFLANSFWLIPYSYSAINVSQIIQNTRINEFSSEEIYERNKTHGNFLSVVSLKGFMLDTIEYDRYKNADVYFMDTWRKHAETPLYKFVYFTLLGIVILGIWKAIRQKNKNILPYTLPLLISFFFLANNTLIIEHLNNLIRDHLPILREVFRFPFTKLIILFSFCLSLFLSYGLLFILNQSKKISIFLMALLFLAILFLSFPAFRGNFFSPLLKSNIPKEYSEVFNYFGEKAQNQRIALLPSSSFWNWQYRSFGQFGSGFIWYGIEQPLLERAFDPWSSYNEQFYNEFSYALKSKDKNRFNQTLAKYDINYLLLDKYLIYLRIGKTIDYKELENFLKKNAMISKIATFGKLDIYKTALQKSALYTLPEDTIKVYPSFLNEHEDITYDIYPADYIVDKDNPDIIPLFPSLYTGKLQKDLEFNFSDQVSSLSLKPKTQFPNGDNNLFLGSPSLFANEFLIPIEITISANHEILLTPKYPDIFINSKKINITEEPFVIIPNVVKNPKRLIFHDLFDHETDLNKNSKSYLLNKIKNVITIEGDNQKEMVEIDVTRNPSTFFIPLDGKKINEIEVSIPKIQSPVSAIRNDHNNVTLIAKNDQKEFSFYLPNLFHQQSYFLLAKTKYKSGLPISFYVDNPFEQRAELETKLSKLDAKNILILPKTEDYFKGYGFHFAVKSLGDKITESNLGNIQVYPLPLKTIRNLYLSNTRSDLFQNQNVQNPPRMPMTYKKINYSLYVADVDSMQGKYVVLSQAFDKGWKAYEVTSDKQQEISWIKKTFPFLFGRAIKDHVLVNNWANGWVIPESSLIINHSSLIIIYWPQYLEYLGFAIVLGTFAWLILTAHYFTGGVFFRFQDDFLHLQ